MIPKLFVVGQIPFHPRIEQGKLKSIGRATVDDVELRNDCTRFLPWFDSYEGNVFRTFQFVSLDTRGDTTLLRTRAISDPDSPFRERRDSSGDLCFRNTSWDSEPVEADLSICLRPIDQEISGRVFHGFKYWYEYSASTPIHRFLDRQTWEVGGNLDDVTICLRNWLTPPRMKIGRDTTYSTVGLDKWAGLLPGNLWSRWSLLPSFDMQYGSAGVLLGLFDRVSLIRSVVESNAGEDCLRYLDLHYFPQTTTVMTNPKNILYSPDILDDVDALNLWMEVSDLEGDRAREQLGIANEPPPAIIFAENVWRDISFDKSYEKVIDVASEFGADYVFIDSVWETAEGMKATLEKLVPSEKQKGTLLEKWRHESQCSTIDFEVAAIQGGEAGLKALCERARSKGIQIISWMATHYSPNTTVQNDQSLSHGAMGIFAAKESGRHPDSGYPNGCWPANLNGPVFQKIQKQVLGVCERTGLAGYLWDSFCSLGWWQVDYSDGSMRPQYDKMGELYAMLIDSGLYIQPESLLTFSNHSCCGLHGGNIYAGDLLGYSYNTSIGLWFGVEDGDGNGAEGLEHKILTGKAPFDTFFQCIAFKRVPGVHFHNVPREQWDMKRVQQIKELFAIYKRYRHLMQKPTVMKGYSGVLWKNQTDTQIYFSFVHHPALCDGIFTDALSNKMVSRNLLQPMRVYLVTQCTAPLEPALIYSK